MRSTRRGASSAVTNIMPDLRIEAKSSPAKRPGVHAILVGCPLCLERTVKLHPIEIALEACATQEQKSGASS